IYDRAAAVEVQIAVYREQGRLNWVGSGLPVGACGNDRLRLERAEVYGKRKIGSAFAACYVQSDSGTQGITRAGGVGKDKGTPAAWFRGCIEFLRRLRHAIHGDRRIPALGRSCRHACARCRVMYRVGQRYYDVVGIALGIVD